MDPTVNPLPPGPNPPPPGPNPPVPNGKEISIGKPLAFNGDRTKIKRFMQDCLVYLVVNRSTYDDDEKRVAFILSFMMEKEATLWKEQYISTRIDNEGVLHLPSWKEFEAKILGDFRYEDQVQ